jgi:hypothetical protein
MEENMNNSEQQLTETAATAEVNNSVQEVEKPKTENATPDKTFSQADVDKMISARLERERKKFEAEKEEAAKLAKMNAEQKKAYEDKKREEEFTAREAAIKEKELRYTALNILEENKLPTKLVECLNLTSAEACNKSIEAIKTAWAEALTAAVDARLKSKQPPAYSGGNEETDPFLEGLGL